ELRRDSRRLSVHERDGVVDEQAKCVRRLFGANVLYLPARTERDSAQLAGIVPRQDSLRHRRIFIWAGSRLGRSRLALEYDRATGFGAGAYRNDGRRRD